MPTASTTRAASSESPPATTPLPPGRGASPAQLADALRLALTPSPGTCQACGARAPTKAVTYTQNIGAVIMRFHRSVKGELCAACSDKHFWQMSAVTFLFGWWGIISFFVTPFVLLGNLVNYFGTRSLDRAAVPLAAGAVSGARPGPSPLLRRGLVAAALAMALAALPLVRVSGLGLLLALAAAAVGGIAFLVALRRPASPGLALAAVAAAALSVMAFGYGSLLALTRSSAARDAELRSVPGHTDFRAANSSIGSYRGQSAFGNGPEAVAVAERFGQLLESMEKLFFTGGDGAKPLLTEGHFLTWVELRRDSVGFLVHVPKLRAYQGEAREMLLKLAWMCAAQATAELRQDGDMRLAVGLRGAALYGGLVIGMGEAEEPELSEADTLVDEKKLYPFFAGPAWEGAAVPAPPAQDPPDAGAQAPADPADAVSDSP